MIVTCRECDHTTRIAGEFREGDGIIYDVSIKPPVTFWVRKNGEWYCGKCQQYGFV